MRQTDVTIPPAFFVCARTTQDQQPCPNGHDKGVFRRSLW